MLKTILLSAGRIAGAATLFAVGWACGTVGALANLSYKEKQRGTGRGGNR